MSNESEIRNLIESWAKAVRAKEIDDVLAHHTSDMVMFDVPPPVVVKGIDAYRETCRSFSSGNGRLTDRSTSCRSISRSETMLRLRPPYCAAIEGGIEEG